MSTWISRLFPRVETRLAEAPHAPLHGRLAEPDWEPMPEQELLRHEGAIVLSQVEDLQSKVQSLHDLVSRGPGKADRQLGFLVDLLDDDLQKLHDRLQQGSGRAADHGQPLDDVDLREIEQRR